MREVKFSLIPKDRIDLGVADPKPTSKTARVSTRRKPKAKSSQNKVWVTTLVKLDLRDYVEEENIRGITIEQGSRGTHVWVHYLDGTLIKL